MFLFTYPNTQTSITCDSQGTGQHTVYLSSQIPIRIYSNTDIAKVATLLLEVTCHMGSDSVTCHPAEVTFQPLPQPKLVLDLATPEGCKAELT